jgi:peptidoglycan hydrolase CwlO-like protein
MQKFREGISQSNGKGGEKMKHRWRYQAFLTILMISALTVSLIGCGVPKTEHDKVVKSLEQANQEKATLTDQVGKLMKEKDSLSQQVAQLQKENAEMKAKMTKPAAKPAAKAPAKKK